MSPDLRGETYEYEGGTIGLEPMSFQDQKVHLFTLKQQKHSHNRSFWCLQNWRAGNLTPAGCQDLERWGTGWQERLPSAFHGNRDIPLELVEFCKYSLCDRTCSLEKCRPAQNKKGILFFWLFDRASNLHTKILLRDGYGKTEKLENARKKEGWHKSPQ